MTYAGQQQSTLPEPMKAGIFYCGFCMEQLRVNRPHFCVAWNFVNLPATSTPEPGPEKHSGK